MNLDLEAARASQKIIECTMSNKSSEVENLITKTLGVLQENGVYASILYLDSRTNKAEKDICPIVKKELIDTTKAVVKQSVNEDNYKYIRDEICSDLDMLLLTKQLWEQILTYARYGAKARE
jgi:hypothetical protein